MDAVSAGTDAWDGGTATDEALLVGMERRIDLSRHRSRKLTREIVNEADLILAMGPQHLSAARRLGGENKSWLLSQYSADGESDRAIKDPFGGALDAYRATADDLETEVALALTRFLAETSRE